MMASPREEGGLQETARQAKTRRYQAGERRGGQEDGILNTSRFAGATECPKCAIRAKLAIEARCLERHE